MDPQVLRRTARQTPRMAWPPPHPKAADSCEVTQMAPHLLQSADENSTPDAQMAWPPAHNSVRYKICQM